MHSKSIAAIVRRNIKRLRKQYGLSQARLASLLNVDAHTIYMYEKGLRSISIEMLELMLKCAFTETKIEQFFKEDEFMDEHVYEIQLQLYTVRTEDGSGITFEGDKIEQFELLWATNMDLTSGFKPEYMGLLVHKLEYTGGDISRGSIKVMGSGYAKRFLQHVKDNKIKTVMEDNETISGFVYKKELLDELQEAIKKAEGTELTLYDSNSAEEQYDEDIEKPLKLVELENDYLYTRLLQCGIDW